MVNMMEENNEYEQKQKRKAEYYKAKAEQLLAESNLSDARAKAISDSIPFGQPILVGHHSEGRARRDQERIHNLMDKSIEQRKTAEYYETKAKNLENPTAISGDDPEVINKLNAKIKILENERDQIKQRSHQPWELSNLSANIRNTKERIKFLEERANAPEIDKEINGVRMWTDKTENRLKLSFPEKPSEEIRTKLKQNGFRWNPTNQTWQRQINNASQYAAENILNEIQPMKKNVSELPKYGHGGFVDKTGLAVVHKGEIIIPSTTVQRIVHTKQPNPNLGQGGWFKDYRRHSEAARKGNERKRFSALNFARKKLSRADTE